MLYLHLIGTARADVVPVRQTQHVGVALPRLVPSEHLVGTALARPLS